MSKWVTRFVPTPAALMPTIASGAADTSLPPPADMPVEPVTFAHGLGPNGVFIAMTVSFSTLAVVSAILFKRGRWRKAAV